MDETGWTWEELQHTPIYIVDRRLDYIIAKREVEAEKTREAQERNGR